MIRLVTLGQFRLESEGQIASFRTRKEAALFVYLAVHQGQFKSRGLLCELVWNDDRSPRIRHRLAQSLYSIRNALPAASLERLGDRVRLAPGSVSLDVDDCRQFILSGQYARALDLFNGEFLYDFWIPSAPVFEEWQLRMQRDINHEMVKAAKSLMLDHEIEGNWEQVQHYARFILDLNEFDEEAQRSRILALAASGDRSRAVAAVEALKQQLSNSTSVADWLPGIEKYLSGETEPMPTTAEGTYNHLLPLIGRNVEFEELRQCWTACRRGSVQMAVVTGAAGIGKSRLCQQLTRLAIIQGGRVFSGACYASERRLPYTGIVDALRDGLRSIDAAGLQPIWASALAQLLPECIAGVEDLSHVDDVSGRRRLFEAVSVLINRVSQQHPCLVIIDDFQWADESTCALLHYILRRSVKHALMILVAIRPEDVAADSGVWTLFDEHQKIRAYARIALQPLPHADCCRIVDTWAERNAASIEVGDRAEIIRRSGGRPYFLLELLKAGATCSGQSAAGDLAAPSTVQEFLRGRFRVLSKSALDILYGLAVIGREAPLELLQRVVSVSEVDAVAGVEELIRQELAREKASTVTFSHALVGEVAYQNLSAVRRRQLHVSVAAALRQDPQVKAGIIAEHFDQAGDMGSAYTFGMRAAKASEGVYAYAEVEHYLRLCLSNSESAEQEIEANKCLAALLFRIRRLSAARPIIENLLYSPATTMLTPVEQVRLQVQRADVLASTGTEQVERVLDCLQALAQEVIDTNDPATVTIYHRVRIRLAHDSGNDDLVLSSINDLLSHAERYPNCIAGINALRIASTCTAVYVDSRRGWRSACRALAAAERFGVRELVVDALGDRAFAAYHCGLLQDAYHASVEAIQLAESVGAIASKSKLLNNLGAILLERGDYEPAKEALLEVLNLAMYIDVPHEAAAAHANLAFLSLETERYDDVNVECRSLLALHERHQMERSYIVALAVLGLAAVRRARFAEAKRYHREILPYVQHRRIWVGDFSAVAEVFLARLAEHEGAGETALARLQMVIERGRRVDAISRCRLRLEWAQIALQSDRKNARRIAVGVRRRAMRMGAKPLVEKADAILDRLNYRDWQLEASD